MTYEPEIETTAELTEFGELADDVLVAIRRYERDTNLTARALRAEYFELTGQLPDDRRSQ